jgi:hypothetical protein
MLHIYIKAKKLNFKKINMKNTFFALVFGFGGFALGGNLMGSGNPSKALIGVLILIGGLWAAWKFVNAKDKEGS